MNAVRTYYRLKPFLPVRIRMALRRRRAEQLKGAFADRWPIHPAAGKPPQGWRGWPGGAKFALVLTHDVEGELGLAHTPALADFEREEGFRSSFNFIPEGGYRVSAELRERLSRDGFEVGVHDLHHDGKLYWSREQFRQYAQRINHYLKEWNAVGFRSGFMHHNLEWLHDLDVTYDCSTFDTDPFEPQPDGVTTIFPFWVVDERGRRYIELPYSLAQDFTLFLILQQRNIDIWKQKLDWIAERGGMALVDVHPDYIAMQGDGEAGTSYPLQFYRELLEYVRSRYAGQYWAALPREVATFFASRQELAPVNGSVRPLEKEGDSRRAPTRREPRPRLAGRRAAVVLYSYYPSDPRPRRAAEALAAQGMTVELLCLRQSSDEPARQVINGVEVTRIPMRRRRGGKATYLIQYSSFLLATLLRLACRCLTRRYDVVHVHNMPDVLVFSALVPKLRGAKVILDLHDPMPELMLTIFDLQAESFAVRMLKTLEKLSIGFADLALTPNKAFRDLFLSRSSPPEKMKIVMNSPEEDIFRQAAEVVAKASARPFRVLYHGSLVARHGLDTGVEAVAMLNQRGLLCTLQICGAHTGYVDSVLELARERGIAGQVFYLGPKSQPEIADLIAQCDLGIIPNRRSPFTEINMPTRIFEYLAMGKPVICPTTRGIQDYFDGSNMIFFEPGSPESLAAAIEWVISNPAEVAILVEKGAIVYHRHLWATERDGFLDAVADLADPPPSIVPGISSVAGV